jgi:hypothetical protein
MVVAQIDKKLDEKYIERFSLFNLYICITNESFIPKESKETAKGTIVENKTYIPYSFVDNFFVINGRINNGIKTSKALKIK